jgi:hypothetical protein
MRLKRLGCFSGVGIISAVIAVLAITGIAFTSGGAMFSPGPLNADQGRLLGGVSSHAEIAGDCKSCHTAPWQAETMDDRCVACHEVIAAELVDPSSIHGKLKVIDPVAQCRACHPEHNGPHAALTVLEEWNFPHQVTGYLLDGHQAKAEDEPFLCNDCHGADVTSFDISVCSDCHEQADESYTLDHGIAFGTACLNCHDGLDTFGNDFDHNIFAFPLTGGHAISLCSQCHLSSGKVSDLKLTPQTCFACHGPDDPHAGKLGTDCASCHATAGWRPANFDHNRASFKLLGSHIAVACNQCHVDMFFVDTPTACFACHQQDDPHGGRFGTDCAACHNPNDWKDWTFDHTLAAFHLTGKHTTVACEACHTSGYRGTPMDCFSCHKQDEPHGGQFGTACEGCHVTSGWGNVTFDHSSTAFPLTGQHNSVACQACHANGVYRGTPKNCFACHASQDAHNGQFGTACESCHVTSGWQDVNFDHNTTGFPLTGQHKNTACTACHTNGQFNGTPANCFACHASEDAHNGQFGTACESCHMTSGWQNVNFDHNTTGFPLTGQHNNTACTACHTNGQFSGTPANCFACHASNDAHNGQFGTDCGSCHSTNSWAGATFNHNNTSFPLTGRHNGLGCTSCHSNGIFSGTPASCYACHAADDNHGGRFGTDCAACHSTNGWGNASFDHNITSFPLEGKHRGVSCESCHSNGVYQGLSTSCSTCHEDKHNGENGSDCAACHTPRGWGD